MTATISLKDICEDAVSYFPTLSQADADAAIATVIERIVSALRADPRMPRFTSENWRLKFADIENRSRAELGELIEGKGDIQWATEEIVNAITMELGKKARRSQKQATERPLP
jgi:hypothetical protein